MGHASRASWHWQVQLSSKSRHRSLTGQCWSDSHWSRPIKAASGRLGVLQGPHPVVCRPDLGYSSHSAFGSQQDCHVISTGTVTMALRRSVQGRRAGAELPSVEPEMVPLLTQKGKQAIHACHAAGATTSWLDGMTTKELLWGCS